MSTTELELALLLKQTAGLSLDDIQIPGPAGTLAKAEAALRFSGRRDKAELKAALDTFIPGLAALMVSMNSNKQVGSEIEALRQKYADKLDPAADAYLRGLVLEGYVGHNKVTDASQAALDANGEASSRHGLRWSYYSAKTFLALNDLPRALAAINRFMAEFPAAKVPFLHLRGLTQRQMGKLDDAVADLLACLRLNPRFMAPTYALRFLIIKGVGVYDSIKALKKALKANPDAPELLRTLADAYAAVDNVDSSIPLQIQAAQVMTLEAKPELATLDWPTQSIARPDFIIIGTPKSGTTSAYQYMHQHPKVLGATVKEISFFADDDKYAKGIDWYLSHFPSLAGHQGFITGEASPGYFYSRDAMMRIAEHFPGVRLILFLRSPTARAISGYYQRKKMHGKLEDIDAYFEKQLALCENKPAYEVVKLHGILSSGVYHPIVKRWHKHFSKEALLIVRAEDLFAEPAKVMTSIFEHIGVEPLKKKAYPVLNKGLYPPASPELIARLEAFYKPHNEALFNLIGRDLQW